MHSSWPSDADLLTVAYVSVQFEHLDGHKVKLEASAVTIPGQVFKVEKEGMPLFDHPDRSGDL